VRGVRRFVGAWLRLIAGTALGALLVPVAAGYLVLAGALLLAASSDDGSLARAGGRARAGARWLAALDRRRVAWTDRTLPGSPVPARRAAAYLALRVPLGLFGGLLVAILAWGTGTAVSVIVLWSIGREANGLGPEPWLVAYFLAAGAVLAFLNLQGIAATHRLAERVAARVLSGGTREQYERRIAELALARTDIVTAVDSERRRIERDLHDGVQQRLVALGMLLGRARRTSDPAASGALVAQAHDEAAQALRELREVAWRVYPTALDDGGLPAALETVAERSHITVRLDVDLPARPAVTVEAAAYFVVSEAVTNAAKHSGAGAVDVVVRREGDSLRVTVADAGSGGADPAGGGLAGLARRVHALDGRLTVDSPPGGPTRVTAVLPCA
jgi:signal transduction histidine kinase